MRFKIIDAVVESDSRRQKNFTKKTEAMFFASTKLNQNQNLDAEQSRKRTIPNKKSSK